MFDSATYIEALNSRSKAERLEALRTLMDAIERGKLEKPQTGSDVNNHIHTTYSFSPYSPTKAVWMSYMAGLCTAGIMDHDSFSGAQEFIEAGSIANLPVTIGLEMRVSTAGTPYKNRTFNNPDQLDTSYVALHGIPHTKLAFANDFIRPYRLARHARIEGMMRNLNALLAPHGLELSFMRDVFSISNADEGGSITERHLMFALCNLLVAEFGESEKLLAFLEKNLSIVIPPKLRALLAEEGNPHYKYDLLGVLKSSFIAPVYIPATYELMGLNEFVGFCKDVGGISCYPYLGDVGDSPTGDKKAQAFEDDMLDDWLAYCKEIGFSGVAYMPTRNTRAQLERIQALCRKLGFIEISGEDINQPRQAFICAAQRDPMFKHLEQTTWALIGHELAATQNLESGMFSAASIEERPSLSNRISHFAAYAKSACGAK